jgi:hypothetical protein
MGAETDPTDWPSSIGTYRRIEETDRRSLREGHVQAAPRLNDSKMKCRRCLSGEEATYRVYSHALDMAVCAACADEARKLEIGVEPLSQE